MIDQRGGHSIQLESTYHTFLAFFFLVILNISFEPLLFSYFHSTAHSCLRAVSQFAVKSLEAVEIVLLKSCSPLLTSEFPLPFYLLLGYRNCLPAFLQLGIVYTCLEQNN